VQRSGNQVVYLIIQSVQNLPIDCFLFQLPWIFDCVVNASNGIGIAGGELELDGPER
jgi:hypothetical protein